MQTHTHILPNISIFNIEDSLEKVIEFFKDHTYSHVAVVEKGEFLGLLSEDDLDNFKIDQKIENYRYNLERFFVRRDTNWLDVLEAFSRNDANLLPVLGANDSILGYYDLTDFVSVFIDTPFFREPGGILVVSKGVKDYSFSEIAQIVESNNARFIGGFISEMENDVVQVTIKVGATNFNEITQTFRRYNYNIIFGNNDDQFLEDLKERSDYLDKYLNV